MPKQIHLSPEEVQQANADKPPVNFLLVWHDRPGTMIVTSTNPDIQDLVIPPYQKVVASRFFLEVPHFVRDVDDGILHTDMSRRVPALKDFSISSQYDSVLDQNQKGFIMKVCREDMSPQIRDNLELHKLLGPGGVTRKDTRVSVRWLKQTQRPMLQALAELEGRWRNRPEVLSIVNGAIEAIDAL